MASRLSTRVKKLERLQGRLPDHMVPFAEFYGRKKAEDIPPFWRADYERDKARGYGIRHEFWVKQMQELDRAGLGCGPVVRPGAAGPVPSPAPAAHFSKGST